MDKKNPWIRGQLFRNGSRGEENPGFVTFPTRWVQIPGELMRVGSNVYRYRSHPQLSDGRNTEYKIEIFRTVTEFRLQPALMKPVRLVHKLPKLTDWFSCVYRENKKKKVKQRMRIIS